LNYAGKFDAAFSAASTGHSGEYAYTHVDSLPKHVPSDAIVVPDAQLLFSADFKRSGVDLILSKDDHELVLHDYFKSEKRAPLASPDGAHLTGDIVSALAGSVAVAQAGGSPAASQVIGHVTKLQGSATAIRNGVSIILSNGDNVEKGDVVESGANSTVGITFIDGTVFGLSSNARMVLNEMVYDPNGSSNSSLMSLVAGTISFVAGETAKHGDMKIDTPVATMGIRGTAVLVQIDFNVPGQSGSPNASFQVLVEPDGTTGSYILFDKTTLQPIAVVNQAGQQVNIHQGIVTQTNAPLPPDVQKLITDVFSLKFTDNSNSNPKTTTAQTDSIVPITTFVVFNPNGTQVPVTVTHLDFGDRSSSGGGGNGGNSPFHIGGTLRGAVVDASGQLTSNFAINELTGKTGDAVNLDTASGRINFVDINAADRPTVSATFQSFAYQNAQHRDVTQSLSVLQLAKILATEIQLQLNADPGNKNNGSVAFTYSLADKAFDFLAAGETLTLTYNLRVDSNYDQLNEFVNVPITVTITGTNDMPVITTGPETVAFFGGKDTSGGNLPTTIPGAPTTGILAFTDVDLTDTHKVSFALTSAVLEGSTAVDGPLADFEKAFPGPAAAFEAALTAKIVADSTGNGAGTISWQLADLPVYLADFIPAGKTLTLTYTVTVTDSQGAKSKQNVIVTITGNNEPAVVWIHTDGDGSPNALWSNATNWETGALPTANDDVIVITDQLHGLTPSYPVTINAAAFAKSLTMNDFDADSPKESRNVPTVINKSTLAISDLLKLQADSTIENSGTITVGGAAEIVDESTLQNSGTLDLAGGGDFKDQASITNSGTIELQGGTLNDAVDIANAGGALVVDGGATLKVNGAAVDGGVITNKAGGTIELIEAILQNGKLYNSGQIKVSDNGNALHNENVATNVALEVLAGAALTVDQGSKISNTGGTVTVDGGEKVEAGFTPAATLTLIDAIITGGTIANNGVIELIGGGVIEKGTLNNSGQVNVSGADNALHNENIATNIALEVLAGGALTIDTGSTINNAGGAVTVDETATLKLDGASISGGTLTISGTLYSDGASSISDADITNTGVIAAIGGVLTIDPEMAFVLTNSGTLEADGGELDISGEAITNTGTLAAIHNSVLKLTDLTVTNDLGTVSIESGSTLDLIDANIAGGAISINGAFDSSGTSTINGVVTNNGTIEVASGALKIDGSISGNGLFVIDKGAVLEVGASAADTQTVEFSGGNAELVLDASSIDAKAQSFGAQIKGLTATDEIDLKTVGYDLDGTSAAYDAATGKFTVTDADGHSVVLSLTGADYGHAHFAGSSDGHGGTLITLHAEDDAPIIAAADKSEAASFNELADTTGSPSIDPKPEASGTIHFTDIDLTDRPTASVTHQDVVWKDGATDLSASLTPAQLSALEHALILSQSGNNSGDIGWNYAIADSALDFLGDGQTLTVTSTVTVDDGYGKTDTANVTITITGSNDAPVVTSDTQSAKITEAADTTDSTITDSAKGSITFSDADLTDTHAVKVLDVSSSGATAGLPDNAALLSWLKLGTLTDTAHGTAGSADWSFSAADKSFDYLAAGQSLTLTYTVQVDDGHGGTITTPVTVTIDGSNDAPVIAFNGGAPLSTSEDTPLKIEGISVSDVDGGNSPEQLTLHVDHGTLALQGNADVQVQSGSDGALTITGTLEQINAALSGVTYTPALNYAGTDTLHLSINDQASSDALTTTKDISIGITPVADPPKLASLHINSVFDDFSGNEIDASKWKVFVPSQLDGANDASVTQTNGHIEIHDHGYLQAAAGFTPTVNTPLYISFTWTFSGSADYLVVTDGTDGATSGSSASPSNGISFVGLVGDGQTGDHGALLIHAGDDTDVADASLIAGTVYDVNITDDGSHQTFVVSDHRTGDVVASTTSDFTNPVAGSLVTFTNREGQDSGHTDTIDNLTISNAYEGAQGSAIALGGLTNLTDTDGSEHLALILSGFPPGATFSSGELDRHTGNWLIKPWEIKALGFDPLKMIPPANYSGSFDLHVDAVVVDKVKGLSGPTFDTKVFSNDVAVTVDHLSIDTSHVTLTENGDNAVSIAGIHVVDTDGPASAGTFTMTATAAASGSSVTPSSDSGSLIKIANDLSGMIYNPGSNPPTSDKVALTITDSFGARDTVHFVFNESGSGSRSGLTALNGTPGKDVIFATSNSDTLTGGGGHDQFVFKPASGPDAAHHTITDFDVRHDTIDLRSFANIDSSTDLSAIARQVGHDTLLTLDDHNFIFLKNVFAGSLHAGDFIVSPHSGAAGA
jgi:fibronectin-binding autotransporter adhesin